MKGFNIYVDTDQGGGAFTFRTKVNLSIIILDVPYEDRCIILILEIGI